jgi:putative cell wall-binding protein
VFTYQYDGASWVLEGEAPGPAGGFYGIHVALDADILAVGDPHHFNSAGAVFIFEWDGSDWDEQAVFPGFTDGGMQADELGPVAVSDGLVVGGGPCFHCAHGHAYVYAKVGGTWQEQASLSASDAAVFDYFGRGVNISGTTLAIGANGKDNYRGAAYIFKFDGSKWVESDKLIASDGVADDYFGYTAIADESYVVGGYNDHKAYVYLDVSDGVERLAGPDRYATAAAVSSATFDPAVNVAYVAVGDNFPDALAAGPLAARGPGPILLVQPTSIPAATAAELSRLEPKSIVILGGTGAVSDTVAVTLDGYTSGSVTRLAGADRYGTAAAISAATFAPFVPVAYVAVGSDFPDALAGGPLAALTDGPILLTQTAQIPPATHNELIRLKPESIVILGGAAVVSASVEALLGSYTSGAVTRLDGLDRYATAAEICVAGFASGAAVAFVAVGSDFPDALAGVPAAALRTAPILLTRTDTIPSATSAELVRLKPRSIVILGGTAVVSSAVEHQLGSYIAP